VGLCLAGGVEQVKKEAAALDISAGEYVEAQHSLAGYCNAMASNARASALGVRSSRTDEPDGMGMCIAGGSQKLQQDAAKLQISVADKVGSDRVLAQMAAVDASALAGRGRFNPNLGILSRHESSLQLGYEVGSAVMGKEVWEEYIKTSPKEMPPQEKPFPNTVTHLSSQERSTGDRDGWIFLSAKKTVTTETISRWRMTDWITYRLPDGSEYQESFRTAISQAYHRNWERYLRMERRNKRDKDAGKLLSRSCRDVT